MIEIEDVEVLSDGPVIVCQVRHLRLGIPPGALRPGTDARKPGDRGKLVLDRPLAHDLGLA